MRQLYHVRMTREILLHLTYEDMAAYSLYDVRTQKKHGFTICIMTFELIHLVAYYICSVIRSHYIIWADNNPNNFY